MLEDRKSKGMRLIVLDILREAPLHGYGISEKVSEIYGVKRPSAGIIYPLLRSLSREGLVRVCSRGAREKKVYEITDGGIVYLNEHAEEVEHARRMLRNVGEFRRLGGMELIDAVDMLIHNLEKLGEDEKREVFRVINECADRIKEVVRYG